MSQQKKNGALLFLAAASVFVGIGLNGMTNAQPTAATLGANSFTGTQGVNVANGDAIVAVTKSPRARAVLGIGAGSGVGGQFETGDGLILRGRGLGHDRVAIDASGNISTTGALRVAGDADVGRLGVALEYVDSASITVAPRSVGSVNATCPSGKQVIGGGFDIGGPGVNAARTLASLPGTGPGRWIVRVSNDPGPVGGADITVQANAVCAFIH